MDRATEPDRIPVVTGIDDLVKDAAVDGSRSRRSFCDRSHLLLSLMPPSATGRAGDSGHHQCIAFKESFVHVDARDRTVVPTLMDAAEKRRTVASGAIMYTTKTHQSVRDVVTVCDYES